MAAVVAEGTGSPYGPVAGDRRTLRLYQRTGTAAKILAEGFVDSIVNPLHEGWWEGTWFADRPDPPEDSVLGGDVLVLEVPIEVAERYGWPDANKPYRQFVLPMHVANGSGPPMLLGEKDTERDPPPSLAEGPRGPEATGAWDVEQV